MTYRRKGQLEIHFNWIFVLVIGAMVLLFFLMIIKGQTKKAETEESTKLVANLDTILQAISTSPDTVRESNIPNAHIEFACEIGLSEYYIQGTGPIKTTYDVIFTPNELKGNQIITWTQTWKAPFKITLFTYMANEKTLFIFVNATGGDETIKELYDGMPENFRKVNIDQADVATYVVEGYERYVWVTTTSITPPNLLEEQSHIRQVPTGNLDGSGTMTFVDKGVTHVFPIPFYTKESIYGAIFTEDEETYICTMNKALSRLKVLSTILEERAETINEEPEILNSPCYDYFDSAATEFKKFTDFTTFDLTAASDMANAKDELKQLNEKKIRGVRCPSLY